VLSLIDQPDSQARCEQIFGNRLGFVPYIMPGFALAKKAAEVFVKNPAVEGLILDKHGIFTFGDHAREAYERMIEFVTLAEEHLTKKGNVKFARGGLPGEIARAPARFAMPWARVRTSGSSWIFAAAMRF
jgi:rhamnose utilization protein RhaD (predicted bifunctional aldolase and dehydrogenase)